MTAPSARPPQDLGFGRVVAQAGRGRLLNRDGSFNIRRTGLGFFESWSAYHWLMGLSWPRFLLVLAGAFLGTNLLFAAVYTALGPGTLSTPTDDPLQSRFLQAFFFSVETLATIGYGHISPRGLAANLVLTLESLTGLLALALVAGLVFSRFSRSEARIRFSGAAVLAPYGEGTGLMFRLVNLRQAELVDVAARLNLSWRPVTYRGPGREFHELRLERDSVTFLPLTWTVVHPIVPGSPLYGVDLDALRAAHAEFYVYVKALDEGSGQSVTARTSYTAEEIRARVRFVNIITVGPDGTPEVDVRRLDEVERV